MQLIRERWRITDGISASAVSARDESRLQCDLGVDWYLAVRGITCCYQRTRWNAKSRYNAGSNPVRSNNLMVDGSTGIVMALRFLGIGMHEKLVLVCGGRDFTDKNALTAAMDRVRSRIWCVMHGGCSGVDMLADEWARANGLHRARVDALWDHHGKAAGPLRNKVMARFRPDVLIAFPGGRGTNSMIKICQEAGINIWRPLGD